MTAQSPPRYRRGRLKQLWASRVCFVCSLTIPPGERAYVSRNPEQARHVACARRDA